MSTARLLAVFSLFNLLAVFAAAQTTVGLWRMGEDDAGAANGNTVNSALTASVGTGLSRIGSGLTYTNSTPAGLSGSTLGVTGTGSGSYTIANNFGLSTNFAIEAWVNFSNLTNTQWVFVLGNGGSSGAAVFTSANSNVLSGAGTGSGAFSSSATISTGTWYHVALVFNNSGAASFYFNGSDPTGFTYTPGTIANNFSIGGDENNTATFRGSIDNVRIFTFSPGSFSTSMLSYSAVPEPSTYAVLAGVVALGLAVWRRRQRTTVV